MDILAWFWSLLVAVFGLLWSLIWFLIGGWVSTLLQIVVFVGGIFILRYGWRRGPLEFWQRVQSVAVMGFSWLRGRDLLGGSRVEVRQVVRVVRTKEFGDINLSTLLTLIMIGGLALLGHL